MMYALCASIMAALLLACLVRAARPGGLLRFLAGWWKWWLIHRPGWLPNKPTGGCILCTTFYVPGFLVAALVLLHTTPYQGATGLNWWAVVVPALVAVLSESFIEQVS